MVLSILRNMGSTIFFILKIVISLYYSNKCIIFANRKLNKKNRIEYIIPISISSILFLFVLTNDLHGEVFSIRGTTYHHEIGYFVICLWIFYQLTVSTILLAIRKIHIKKDWKTIFIFLPIILGIIYTIRICNRNRIFYKN